MISSLNDIPAVKAYLRRIGAEPRSLRTAVVRERYGSYWQDIAVIKVNKDGSVTCTNLEFAPREDELRDMASEILKTKFPELQPLAELPPMAKPPWGEVDPADLFEFRDLSGQITMLQVRKQRRGEKSYIPYTYWTDGEWRISEPDGPLPLYNLHRLNDATTVFIHEGAKAARHCQWLADAETSEARAAAEAHPWGRELSHAVHLGWVGGALSPSRTDWSAIMKTGAKIAYVVADNDRPGLAAIPKIARQLRIPTFSIEFNDLWPASFDLADDFPRSMFRQNGGHRYYIGPSFRSCLQPATWATDQVPNPAGTGRPVHLLRESFKELWAYVDEADFFVCTAMPEIVRTGDILNKMLAPFSHVSDTSRLINKAYNGRTISVCYRPDLTGRKVTNSGRVTVNLHVEAKVRPEEGSAAPWEEYLAYMFPDEKECHEVKRWCATLIAKPGVRMGYGLLLISERQGIGKTTLGAHVLAPLVGQWNTSFPSELDIMGQFNDWIVGKRLAIISEIYTGHSWRSYHTLKSAITDLSVTVNQKYQKPYLIDNWCHIFASSNSERALKMEMDDRRWFYPQMTETPWPQSKFAEFREWLEGGGLGIIKRWADNWKDYVAPGERAPLTSRKMEMIEGSRSEAQREVYALAEAMQDLARPGALGMRDVVLWARDAAQGKVYDTDYELRRVMREAGMGVYFKRLKIHGRMDHVLVNDQLAIELQKVLGFSPKMASQGQAVDRDAGDKERLNAASAMIREHLMKAADVIGGEF
ncbi:MAG: hypothetical protein EB165_04665 [Euryarchaeota archaeon]|nr:hypothetical protein [Euryarchaeota archaeon]